MFEIMNKITFKKILIAIIGVILVSCCIYFKLNDISMYDYSADYKWLENIENYTSYGT